MLSLKNISWATEGGAAILDSVSLDVPDGMLTVITGPNGSGKTSLAKIIAGIEVPQSGRLLLDGEDILHLDITERAKAGIAYAFQNPVKFKGITVQDMLSLAAGRALTLDEACGYLHLVGLCAPDYIGRDVDASLSGGESKRIEIAGVLARAGARVMIFDEPEAGIDLWSFAGLTDTFKALKGKKGCSLLIISHQERILEIADRIVVLANGKVRQEGAARDVLGSLLAGEKAGLCPLGKQLD